jgi:pilus assembly protein FimV
MLNKARLFVVCCSFAISTLYAAESQSAEVKGPKNSSAQYSGVTYGPIKSSDTLWQIASRYRQNKDLSIYQVMYGIYQLNPDAFEQENINLVKNGTILKLPSERYALRIDNGAALERFQADEKILKIAQSSLALSKASSSANVDLASESLSNAAANSKVSKNDLDETKALIEERLGALDEAQSRQFLEIRQQFAESIGQVQAILTENQKMFERLDKVNTDIDQMRVDEVSKSQQMDQMGQSIEELLARSRLEDELKTKQAEEANSNWLDSPFALAAITVPLTLSLIGALAYFFLMRRNSQKLPKELDLVEDDDISLEPHSSALDDLSDALSDELSDELGDELDDDNLFGDDDLLDDVLAEELRESLDDALDDSLDDSFEEEIDAFDDLGDDVLDSSSADEPFEEGEQQLEQNDLDSLFDEDEMEDLLTDPDDEAEAELIDSDIDELLAESATSEGDIAEQVDDDLTSQAEGLDEQEPVIATIPDQEEPPEISIDELFEGGVAPVTPEVISDEDEDINEDVLQKLDNEISTQNAEIDNLTGNLLDELEQVEQMRDMLGEFGDEDEAEENIAVQPSIQKLDEDSLAAGFDENAGFEPDFLDVDEETENTSLDDTDETEYDLEEANGVEEAGVTEEISDIEALDEAEELEQAEILVDAEESDDVEETDEVEELDEIEEIEESDEFEENDDLDDLDDGDAVDEAEEQSTEAQSAQFEQQSQNDNGLDEDQLEKALEDFEHQELDEVLKDLTSNKKDPLDSLDDLEFGAVAEDYLEHKSSDSQMESEEPDDSLLEQALADLDSEAESFSVDNENDDPLAESTPDDSLDDFPGLGDWLTEDKQPDSAKSKKSQLKSNIEDDSVLEEIEDADFDELLNSIDISNDKDYLEADDGLDISALLSEPSTDDNSGSEATDNSDEDDFLDVEALLNDSFDEENDSTTDKDFDLSAPLASFFGDPLDVESIDVDDDSGFGAKLDLAHAYIEIGEHDSAVELLQDIIDNGDQQQIAEAQAVLANLSV